MEKDVGFRELMSSKRLWERDGMIKRMPLLDESIQSELLHKIRQYDLKLSKMIKLHIRDDCDLTEEMKCWSPDGSTSMQNKLSVRSQIHLENSSPLRRQGQPNPNRRRQTTEKEWEELFRPSEIELLTHLRTICERR